MEEYSIMSVKIDASDEDGPKIIIEYKRDCPHELRTLNLPINELKLKSEVDGLRVFTHLVAQKLVNQVNSPAGEE